MNEIEEKVWFLHNGQDREGPLSVDEAKTRLATSTGAELYAWTQGMADWKRTSEIDALRPAPLSPPPAPTATQVRELSEPEISIQIAPSSSMAAPHAEVPKDAPESAARNESAALSARTGLLAALVIVIAGAGGYYAWPRLTNPGGLVNRWITKLPEIPDVTTEQKNLLQAAASSGAADSSSAPIEIVLAASQTDAPVAYLSGNVLDGTVFTFELRPNPAMIATPSPAPIRIQVTLSHRLGRAGPIKATDGKSIPRGEYQAVVIDAEGRTRISHRWFIGPESGFQAELNQYQQSLRAQAQAELADLRNFSTGLAAILEGDVKAAAVAIKARGPARAKAQSTWEQDRAKLEEGLSQLTQKDVRFFKSARNAALTLHDSIKAQHDLQLAFLAQGLSSDARAKAAADLDEASKKIALLQTDLASKLDFADKRLTGTTGYLEEEK